MGNSYSIDSYLTTTACGGRNITWNHLNSNGASPSFRNNSLSNIPIALADCTNIARVLRSHCCEDGVCRPSSLDHEFDRYDWYDWNGLGDPTIPGDGKVLVGAKGRDGKKCQPPLLRRTSGIYFGGEVEMGREEKVDVVRRSGEELAGRISSGGRAINVPRLAVLSVGLVVCLFIGICLSRSAWRAVFGAEEREAENRDGFKD